MLKIRLRGHFSVQTNDGIDLAPKGKKAIGVLALLAECDTKIRSRRWLEDKLWSDRAPEQARGSLRTTLSEIRRSFADAASVLGADRNSVWLDASAISTDLETQSKGREFLEGLDIADPEFNDWLIRKRLQHDKPDAGESDAPISHRRVVIQCGMPWRALEKPEVLSEIVNDQIGKIASDFIALSICSKNETAADLIVRTSVHECHPRSAVYVQVIDPRTDTVVHSDHCFAENLSAFLSDQEELGRFCWNVADLALEKLPRSRGTNNPVLIRSAFVQDALENLLSFNADQMRSSVTILENALDHMNDGLFLALKAWSLMSLIMEDFLAEDKILTQEIRELLLKAIETSPQNSMVAAVAANVKAILFQDINEAMQLSRRALRDNPNSLFALQAMSACYAAQENFEMAYELSKRSKNVSGHSKFEAMCNLHHALLCIRMNQPDEALKSAQLATSLSPNYRASRRQIIGLGAMQNNRALIAQHVEYLNKVEPNFSVERFLFDRSYPTNTLRNSGYLLKASGFLSEAD